MSLFRNVNSLCSANRNYLLGEMRWKGHNLIVCFRTGQKKKNTSRHPIGKWREKERGRHTLRFNVHITQDRVSNARTKTRDREKSAFSHGMPTRQASAQLMLCVCTPRWAAKRAKKRIEQSARGKMQTMVHLLCAQLAHE